MKKHVVSSILAVVIALVVLHILHYKSMEAGSARYLNHYKAIVKELSSEEYQGRGYAMDGVRKAGDFIFEEFKKSGVDSVVAQPFDIDVNTFPGKMEASADGRALEPGKDFVMREYSPGIQGEYSLYFIDTLNYNPEKIFADLEKAESDSILVVCDFWFTYKHSADFRKLQSTGCRNAGLIYTWDEPLKFYKAYASKVVDKPIVWTTSEAVKGVTRMSFDIENKFLENYTSDNIIGIVKGRRSDSCFVFTAHYDHLGNLGKDLYFPGANDNASGTAAVIALSQYYSSHTPEFDIYFIAFSGEDTNLNGSTWYAEHPCVPLDEIKYLINLDMIGDNNPVQYCEVSDAGMYAFPLWESLNAEGGYFESLNRGDLAANSDHYPFAVRGVPCIFFENEEGDTFKYYHTAEDNWQNAVFTTFRPIFHLVTDFVAAN